MALIDATKKNTTKTVKEIAAGNAPGSNVARALLKANPNFSFNQSAPAKKDTTYESGPLSNAQIDKLETRGVVQGNYIPNTQLRLSPSGTLIKEDTTFDATQNKINDIKKVEETPQIAVDNGTSRDDEKKIRNEIKYQSERGPIDMSYLTGAEQFARESWKDKEVTANTMFDRVRRGTEQAQLAEKGSTSASLARAGGYLGFTGSGEGVMLSLERSHRAEILDIESKRTQALAEARQAYNEQMYGLALEKQELATEYEKQQYEEKQKYFEEVKKIQKEEADKSEQERVNIDIFNALQKEGIKTEFDVFGALKGRATPEQISSFFKSINPKTTESDIFKPSNTQSAMLLGAGFSSDDIQALYDHLNEYGYDDVLKASLTPYQRRVLDDMLIMNEGGATRATYAPTSDMKEYELAVSQGYRGTFMDWKNGMQGNSISWEDYELAAKEEMVARGEAANTEFSFEPNSQLYKDLRAQWESDFGWASTKNKSTTKEDELNYDSL